MSTLIIYGGSTNKKSTTLEILTYLKSNISATLITLSNHNISYFDYEHKNKNDDFQHIAQLMLSADTVIFATPVYWYAMSAQLKTFFDRLNDLITIHKDWGRKLKGKQTILIATGYQPQLPEGFNVPFKKTSEYFGMNYLGEIYISSASYSHQDNLKILTKTLKILKI